MARRQGRRGGGGRLARRLGRLGLGLARRQHRHRGVLSLLFLPVLVLLSAGVLLPAELLLRVLIPPSGGLRNPATGGPSRLVHAGPLPLRRATSTLTGRELSAHLHNTQEKPLFGLDRSPSFSLTGVMSPHRMEV